MIGKKIDSPSLLDFHDFQFKLSHTLSPILSPKIFLLDTLGVTLTKTEVNNISIPRLIPPVLSPSYCLLETELCLIDHSFNECAIEDLSLLVKESLTFPSIESIFEPLNHPKLDGKAYSKNDEEKGKISSQPSLFSDAECRHGLREDTCSGCINQKEKKQKVTGDPFDVFDLIFPILHPPLKLDSISEFLPGKTLRPFQPKGIRFLVTNEAALLGDEMGLGKTIQAIVAMSILFHSGKISTALIVCPRSVFTSWEKEFDEWAPQLRVITVRGLRARREVKWSIPSHVYLTTYETLREDLDNIPDKNFDLFVLDEIQKIKNPTALVTKTVRQINAKFRWGLSGTPLENRIEDLISIFSYLKPGVLRPEDANWPEIVRKKMDPYFLRRRKADVLKDLRGKVKTVDWVSLSPAQQEAYDKAEKEGVVALNELGETITVPYILALITKLKQICNYDIVSGESSKLNYLIDKLESVQEQGDKALVFSQFPNKTLTFLASKLIKFNPQIYHGGLSDRQRDTIVKDFQENDENRVLLMSVKAGGLGITLTRANYVYHFDQWWNPATSAQAEDRAHRIGQEKTVFVFTLMTTGTIEERIHQLLEKKRSLFNEVIDNLSDTDLNKVVTKEELLGLFNLNNKGQDHKVGNTSSGKIDPEDLQKLSAREFEKLTAKLYQAMGYYVKETPITGDEGVDLYVKRTTDSGSETIIVQCKHYPNGMVGVEHIRALYGVLGDKQNISRGVLVTSGKYTSGAREFASGKRIELYDVSYLLGLLIKYKVSLF